MPMPSPSPSPSSLSMPSARRLKRQVRDERGFSPRRVSERGFSPHRASERGFSLLSAIFLMVMLSVLGAALATISSGSQIAVALDIQGERAYQAARAGTEWGLHRQLRSDRCASSTSFALPGAANSSAAAGTVASATSTLASFTVTVTCQVTRTPIFGAPIAAAQRARASPLNPDGLTLQLFAATSAPGDANVINIADTSMLAEGMLVGGSGIAASIRILNVMDATTLRLTDPVLLGLGKDLTFRSELDRYTLTSTACNQPAAGACPHVANANHPNYVQRVIEVRF